jgi:ribonuclease HII
MLALQYDELNMYEIGVDEAGRGPLFGPLYVAAVVLPKEGFDGTGIKDSKKIKNKAKLSALAEYIKKNALAWSIQSVDHNIIDSINIRQSVFQGMHASIRDIFNKMSLGPSDKTFLLIDGNDFKPFYLFDETLDQLVDVPYSTIEGGDNKYRAIASASILAKDARDRYISDLCQKYPDLSTRYLIDKNMGYGTKTHLDGIRQHGVTKWHRKTFGICKSITPLHEETTKETI